MNAPNTRPIHVARCMLNVRGSNRLLTLLPADDYQRMLPKMEKRFLNQGDSVHQTGKPVSHVYFPLTAVFSVVVRMCDGETVEAATIGNEGMVGLPLFLGGQTSPNDAFAQIAGETMRMSADVLREETRRSAAFGNLLRLYAQGYLTQVSQSSACNRLHPVDQRLCRWVLMTHDRVGQDTLPLTQEFLAVMLGVRRASVSTAAAVLQKAGFIEYERGIIHVVDRDGLERGSCECYGVVRAELERLLCDAKPNTSRTIA